MTKRNRSEGRTGSAAPSSADVRKEIARLNYRSAFHSSLFTTIAALVIVAAGALLVANMWLSVFRIFTDSMEPEIPAKVLVAATKTGSPARGDVVAFYHDNSILVRRVVGVSGDVIEVDDDGAVTVNGRLLDEPYVEASCLGESNVEYPLTVPEDRYFVLGDNREKAVDSRNSAVGCVASELIIGKVIARVWPYEEIGLVR